MTTTLSAWAQQRDIKPPKGENTPVIRQKIRRVMGPYELHIVSSAGYRTPYNPTESPAYTTNTRHEPGGGFVSVKIWRRPHTTDDPPTYQKSWQIESEAELRDELARLYTMIDREESRLAWPIGPLDRLDEAIRKLREVGLIA